MSILSYNELCDLVETGVINAPLSAVQGSSIDVTLGGEFLKESSTTGLVYPRVNGPFLNNYWGNIIMEPGEFVLASIREKLNLPLDLSAQFLLKSSVARAGVGHMLATWVDPGYKGILTLELTNDLKHHSIVLEEGMPVGQLIFHKHTEVPYTKSYAVRGQYHGDTMVQGNKGAK